MPVVLRTRQYYLHFESDFWECACVCMCVGGACKRERERTRNEQIGMRERASLFLRSFSLSLVCFSIEPCEHACDARGNKNRNKGKKSFFVSLVHCVQGLEQHCEALLLLCHFGANSFLISALPSPPMMSMMSLAIFIELFLDSRSGKCGDLTISFATVIDMLHFHFWWMCAMAFLFQVFPHSHRTHCNRFGFGRSLLRSCDYRAMDECARMCICPPKIACFAWKVFSFCTHVPCICSMCKTILMCGVEQMLFVCVCVLAWLRV